MSRYDQLYIEYVEELKRAQASVTTWWDSMFEAQIKSSGDFETAESIVMPKWPCGPVSHPRIIAVYRKYFLLCEEINKAADLKLDTETPDDIDDDENSWGKDDDDENEEGLVEPQAILIDRLASEDEELGDFMSGLVFSPIGTGENGEAV